ncbi:hypothetical protein HOLleu_06735 [Holothuria leucospilota]|uniref:Uncharacterized protein n=1 Tax=Holothuria leucospilota TaxID=206669 RepID=A0A9Q1CNC0_HOLLE|nr:hypothetical protein HOLleu_06735 [Holothuria leucospilota]
MLTVKSMKARKIANLVGKMVAAKEAINYSMAHLRYLQRALGRAIQGPEGFEEMVQVPREARKDFSWWIENLQAQNGCSIRSLTPDLIIQTDASLTGWGAVCGASRTGGHWLEHDKTWHINVLELQAIYLALNCFTRNLSNQHILIKSDNVSALSYINRQGGGGDEKQGPPKGVRHNLEFLPGTSVNLDRRACPRYSQWGSRLPFKALGRCIRLDVRKANFHSNFSGLRAISDRPFCKSFQRPMRSLLQLEARPRVKVRGKCIHPDMDRSCSICVSPVHPHCEVPEESKGGEGNNLPCCDTQMDSPALVRPGTRDECADSITDSSNPQQPAAESGGTTPLNSEQDPLPNRLESFRGKLSSRGLSEGAQTLITSSWRKGTSIQYDCVWKIFSGWCSEREINPFCATLEEVSNLAEQFEKGKSYSTLNIFRSALSATLSPVDGKPLGPHPLICRLLKRAGIKRPPQAKYSFTWDVQVVLDYIQSLGGNSELSLKLLSKKGFCFSSAGYRLSGVRNCQNGDQFG